VHQEVFSEYVTRSWKLEIGIWLIFYGIRRVELHGEKEHKLPADAAFLRDNPAPTSAVLRAKFSDRLSTCADCESN
jgi:hypothetical protein